MKSREKSSPHSRNFQIRFNIISYLHLSVPYGLTSFGIPNWNVISFCLSMRATWFDHSNNISSGKLFFSSSLYIIYIYRVFTKEWRGFNNLLNDYILQLDGTGMYESYSIVFSNTAGSDVLQMETTTYMGRIRLSCGCVSCDPGCTHWRIMINALKKLGQLPLLTVYVLPV
jgi:hypothetical protein